MHRLRYHLRPAQIATLTLEPPPQGQRWTIDPHGTSPVRAALRGLTVRIEATGSGEVTLNVHLSGPGPLQGRRHNLQIHVQVDPPMPTHRGTTLH